MRYSDFQLAVRNLRGSDLTESGLDEISITDLAQKESELIEHLILNQPENRLVKVRLLHEIDECLIDFYFFVSHAKRELDRARKIGDEGTTWQRVRDIISGVEGGLDTYLAMLKKYFPEEMERYDTGTSEDIITHFSKHIFNAERVLPTVSKPDVPARAHVLTKFKSKIKQLDYWEENISIHVQDRAEAAEYWGVPEHLLIRSETRSFSKLGFAPKQVYEQFIEPFFFDKDVIFKVSRRNIKTFALPGLVEDFEKEIARKVKFGLAEGDQIIERELKKCDSYNYDLDEKDVDLSLGSDYYFRTLYHVFYREYLQERREEINNLETKDALLITSKPKAEVSAPTAKAAPVPENEQLSKRLGTKDLTIRENVLVHCYRYPKEYPIPSGQPGYADYLIYGRPTDRIRYPNESRPTAKSLIKSIEKIYPYLTEKEVQQAKSEVNTIKANFFNQL